MRNNVKWFVMILFIIIMHLPYISNGFVWLDHIDLEEGRALVSLPQWLEAFRSNYADTGFYRPLVTLAHSIHAELYGENAAGYHVTNLFLHLLVCGLAVVFINCFTKLKQIENYIVFLIVGIHSISWFTVGTIAHLPELLMTLFVMATVICYAKGKSYWVVGISALLALLSKETALFYIPACIAVWNLATLKTRTRRIHIVSLAAVFTLYIVARLQFVPELWKTTGVDLSLSQAVGTRLSVVGRLAYHLIVPATPPISDSVRIVSIVNWQAILALVVIVILTFIIGKKGLGYDLSKSLLLLAIALAPVLNIIPLPRFYSINYAYFATIPLAFLIVCAVRMISKKSAIGHRSALLIVGVWITSMSMATYTAGPRLRNDKELFLPEINKDDAFREGHFYIGNYYFSHNDLEKAEQHYLSALTDDLTIISYVDKRASLINLTGVYVSQNKLTQAAELLDRASIGASNDQLVHVAYNKSLIFARLGEAEQVVDTLYPFIENSLNVNLLLLWSDALIQVDKKGEAIKILQKKHTMLKTSDRERIQLWLDTNSV